MLVRRDLAHRRSNLSRGTEAAALHLIDEMLRAKTEGGGMLTSATHRETRPLLSTVALSLATERVSRATATIRLHDGAGVNCAGSMPADGSGAGCPTGNSNPFLRTDQK